jgi:hypothetical protein
MVEYKRTTTHLGFHLDILGSGERTQLFNATRFAQPELYRQTVNTVSRAGFTAFHSHLL